MKKCTKCKGLKPYKSFNLKGRNKDGHSYTCKLCDREYNRNYKILNKEKLRLKYKLRSEAEKETARNIAKTHYYKTINKQRAKSAVKWALKSGKMEKQPCEVCGSLERLEAHHESYLKEDRLKINWLCSKHHKQRHVDIRIREEAL